MNNRKDTSIVEVPPEEEGVSAPHWVPHLRGPVPGRKFPTIFAVKISEDCLSILVRQKVAGNPAPSTLSQSPYADVLVNTHLVSGQAAAAWGGPETCGKD